MRTPTRCDRCGSTRMLLEELVPGSRSYNHRKEWPFVYTCRACGAECGVRRFSPSPMGYMADAETRYWRSRAHNTLDKLWQSRRSINRSLVYRNLAVHMMLPPDQCHIGQFNVEQCKQVIEFGNMMAPRYTKRRRK